MRLAYSQQEAAKVLGVSTGFFVKHIEPELRVKYVGRRRIYAAAELQRWLDKA